MNLPMTELELSDLFELLGTKDIKGYKIRYSQKCELPKVCQCKDISLYELNCLAMYIERMDDAQYGVFEELMNTRENTTCSQKN